MIAWMDKMKILQNVMIAIVVAAAVAAAVVQRVAAVAVMRWTGHVFSIQHTLITQ